MDIMKQVILNAVNIGILQRSIEYQSRNGRLPQQADIDRFKRETIAELNTQHPDLGLEMN